MLKLILPLLFLSSFAHAQDTNLIITGEKKYLNSSVLGEKRELWIHLPKGYKNQSMSYPVIYVIDGEGLFNMTQSLSERLSEANMAPEAIVVGVVNTNRNLNFTPVYSAKMGYGGGADAFMDFFRKELFSFVEKNYRTQAFRVLIGHSYGGLFAMNAFISDTNMFNATIAISPSMWFADGLMIKKTDAFFEKNKSLERILYVTLGDEGEEQAAGRIAEIIRYRQTQSLKWEYAASPDETHTSVPARSIYFGLKFIFSGLESKATIGIPGSAWMAGGMSMPFEVEDPTGKVFYTSDNTMPSSTSEKYTKPVVIRQPYVMTAATLLPYGFWSTPAICTTTVHDILKNSVPDHSPKKGITYAVYEGTWRKLPDFTKLKALEKGISDTISRNLTQRKDTFGILFSGYISIPADGMYLFDLSSDDGSILFVDGLEFINLDGNHGLMRKSFAAPLQKGFHRFELKYYDNTGNETLKLKVKKAGPDKWLDLPDAFWH